jgi:hypothetical protein
VFANLVEFDTQYGHRNDPGGFARALVQFDERLGELLARLRGLEARKRACDETKCRAAEDGPSVKAVGAAGREVSPANCEPGIAPCL